MTESQRRWWPGASLLARFDDRVLCPPTEFHLKAPKLSLCNPQQHAAWPWLRAWCEAGLGTGRVPFWRPWQSPAVSQRLSIAVMVDEPDVASSSSLRQVVQAFCLHIDGSDKLRALPSAGVRLAWRLIIKLSECRWWRGSITRAPWDAGYLRSDIHAQVLQSKFRPRRPSLVVVPCWSVPALAHLLRHWHLQSATFDHAVRLLVLLPAGSGRAVSDFDALWEHCQLPVTRYPDQPGPSVRQGGQHALGQPQAAPVRP
jgi:hypothetical protein